MAEILEKQSLYPYVPGEGNPAARLIICGEAPGEVEEREGGPFRGPSGKEINELLNNAGSNRSEVYCTNVFKYRPPQNDISRAAETGHTIEEGLPQLFEELSAIKPNAVLAVGGTALTSLTGLEGIGKYRGSILWSNRAKCKVIPTIHPAAYLGHGKKVGAGAFKYLTKAYIQADFRRAVEESTFPEYKPPHRLIEICRSAHQVYKFLERYPIASHPIAYMDIEAIGCVPVCIGFAFASSHAISIPLRNAANWRTDPISDHELDELWRLVDKILRERLIIAHNAKYDAEKLEALGFSVNYHADTQLMAHTTHPEFPKSLQFLTSIYTKEPYYKDEYQEFVEKNRRMEDLMSYNGKDCCVLVEIFEALKENLDILYGPEAPFYWQYVNKLHKAYIQIERVGWRTDENRRKELYEKYRQREISTDKELQNLCGRYVNVNSSQGKGSVPDLLYNELGIPKRKGAGEEVLVSLLGNTVRNENHKRIIELILEGRRIKKTIGTYILTLPDFDGRVRSNYRIVGTESGRTSTSNLAPPVRPNIIIKQGKEKKKKAIGYAFQTATKHGEIGPDIRSMYIPDEGMVFGEADLGQAEARIVALLSENYELLKKMDTPGYDVHKWFASNILGLDESLISQDMRFIGKEIRHAFAYDIGKKTAMVTINTDARKFGIKVNISEKAAGEMLSRAHKLEPGVKEVFHEGIKRTLKEKQRTLINPFGRIRQYFERWGEDLFREAYNGIPQSTVRDQVAGAILRIISIKEIAILGESHDAIYWESREEEFEEDARLIKREMERVINFEMCSLSRGELVIPCEIKIGRRNLKEMEKYDGI